MSFGGKSIGQNIGISNVTVNWGGRAKLVEGMWANDFQQIMRPLSQLNPIFFL